MMTNSHIKNIIIQNLTDNRIFAIQAFIARLLERKVYGDGISRYRVKDKITNSDVTNLTDFINKIDTNSLHPDYFYYSGKMEGDRIHPMSVKLSNFLVTIDEHSQEDDIYFSLFGKGNKNILFLINYLSDGDIVLPMKIFEVRLINTN